MSESEQRFAFRLANTVLDDASRDPDSDLSVLARQFLRALEVRAWKPIETAPRTTRSILVWCPELRNTHCVSWLTGTDEPGQWHFFGGTGVLTETPTLWQAMPEPPK